MNDMQEAAQAGLASLALTRADEALIKIESHEDLCAERYSHIHSKLDDMKSTVTTVLKILAWGGSTVFGLLILVLGFLGSRAINNNDAEVRALRDQLAHTQKAKAPVMTADFRY